MTQSENAPWPWSTSPTDETVVIDATGNEVAAIDGDYNSPETWPVMEANALLIAAAPDMLEAFLPSPGPVFGPGSAPLLSTSWDGDHG